VLSQTLVILFIIDIHAESFVYTDQGIEISE